jgi:hypothetical protein
MPLIELPVSVGSLFLWDESASITTELTQVLEWRFIVDSLSVGFSNDSSYSGLP